MSSIDTRIVEMRFNNSQFLAGVKETLASMNALNKGTKLEGAGKGLADLNAAGKRVDLSHIGSAIDGIKSKFSALSVVGITALSNIANKLTNIGLNAAKSFTIKPITDGLREYETGLNSVQTILANTAAAGTTLPQVNSALSELNKYSDQTIYNFGEMTKNIGTFTAAGVDLKTATGSIKGIANLAALSGSNSQQASTAMYQLSQAISSGRVSLQDWNSVVNAGMGGSVFQRALAQNAVQMGKLDKGAVKLSGSMKNVTVNGQSFRDSISAEGGKASWLTSDVLTKTLQQFTGDLTDAQLKAQGFNDAQIKSIQAQAKMAKAAATEVKTFTQLVDTVKESVGSGWAQTWQTVIGDFSEAKKLWTGVNNVISGAVGKSADARNKMLADWKKLGGRDDMIAGFKNLFNGLGSIIKPIQEAFREIFPRTTGKQLAEISKAFKDITAKIKIGSETADRLKRTFAGVFAVFGIGWEIIKGFGRVLTGLFKTASGGSGGFLKFTASIGDFLVALHKAMKNGEGFKKVMEGIGKVLGLPIKLLGMLFGGLSNVDINFKNVGKSISDFFGKIGKVLGPVGEQIKQFFSNLGKGLSGAGDGLGGGLLDSLSKIDFGKVLDIINTGLFAGLILLIKKFVGQGGDLVDAVGGWGDTLKAPFESLTGTLDEMQNTLRAATLLQIALAIGILAASIVALSTVDADGLKRALGAMAASFSQLIITMALFQKISIGGGMGQLILLAIALRILTSSVKALAELDWEELGKGLGGTAVLLGALTGAANLMPSGKKMISSSIGLLVMAAAVKVLASAVKDLSDLNWENLAKGLVGVGGLLGALALFTKFSKANAAGLAQGAGIILLALGIKILAGAIKDFSKMSWTEIGKGLAAMAGGLLIMGTALALIPPTSIFSAVGVLLVASSLGMIADAMKKMGGMDWESIGKGLVAMAGALTIIGLAISLIPPTSVLSAAAVLMVAGTLSIIGLALQQMATMSWEEIAKGLVTLAGALGIIAIAMSAMTTAIFGAAALLVVTAALSTLAPILLLFGNMSWEAIGKGLIMLAGAFTVIGLAGLVLTPIIPSLLLFGAAITLIGAGIGLAGAGAFLFGAGLASIAAAGAGAVAVITSLVSGLIAAIPALFKAVGLGIVELAKVIATAGPQLVAAFTTILSSMLTAVRNIIPQIGATISVLLTTILGLIRRHAPQIIDTFVEVARKFLSGVRALVPDIIRTFETILTGILGSIRRMAPQIIATMIYLIDSLLNAIGAAVPRFAAKGVEILAGFLNGIASRIGSVVTAAVNIIVAFISGIIANLPRIIQSGVDLILAFVNGLASAIRANSGAMGEAGANLASAIVEGMVRGLGAGIGKVVGAAKNLAKSALNAAKGLLGINSPSKKFMELGKWSAIGYAKGLTGNQDQITAATTNMQKAFKDALLAEQKNIKSLESKLKTLNRNRRRNAKAIRETTAALKEAKSEYTKTVRAQQLFNTYGDETARLKSMANSIAGFGTKIDEAKKKVEEATKVRDDYAKSVEDQYDNLPDISKETKLPDFIKSLQKQIVDTQIFKAQLKKLKELGINDEMYKTLVSKGVDAIPFVTQILDRGKKGVTELNTLGKALDTAADGLAKDASKALYQAGVDAAAGLVKGLENQKAALQKQMNDLAMSMVNAIKKTLGIKSPSRAFMEVGGWSVEGLAKGLLNSRAANDAATQVGSEALIAMKKSMTKVSLGTEVLDLRPQITPVLDLSSVAKEAGKLGAMLGTEPLNVSGSYAVAANMARVMNAQNGSDSTTVANDSNVQNVVFNQYNNSPKELSSAEIYRQTRNQISRAKEALSK